MAKERTSKLQRWILKHAYMKMKQMKMPDDWIWCRYDEEEKHDEVSVEIEFKFNVRPSLGTYARTTLMKYDILANYFHLTRSDYPSHYAPGRYFAGSRGTKDPYDRDQNAANNHAHVTVHNCLKNMKAKGLIKWLRDPDHSNADEILLTEKGKSLILYDIKTIKDKGIDDSEDIDPEALEAIRSKLHDKIFHGY